MFHFQKETVEVSHYTFNYSLLYPENANDSIISFPSCDKIVRILRSKLPDPDYLDRYNIIDKIGTTFANNKISSSLIVEIVTPILFSIPSLSSNEPLMFSLVANLTNALHKM